MIPRNSNDPYRMAHDHVRAVRGKASDHRCTECGNQAEHWSLAAQTIGNLHVVRHNGHARWISDAVFDYEARCAGCHKRHDVEQAAQRALEDEGLSDYLDFGDGYLGYRAVGDPDLLT